MRNECGFALLVVMLVLALLGVVVTELAVSMRLEASSVRSYKDGVLADEVTDVTAYWRDDLVAFLLGCSFTFEWALLEAGIDLWHVKHGKNVAMWRTSIDCRPAGVFHGPMVVSMRPTAASRWTSAACARSVRPGASASASSRSGTSSSWSTSCTPTAR